MSTSGPEAGSGTGSAGASNGSAVPPEKKPFPRLSSFKLPRDLTLGAGAAQSSAKKVFTPNLNVVRNKNKQSAPNSQNNRKDNETHRRDKTNKKHSKNGPSILKSGGVFSEGLGVSERHTTRSSYGRDSESTPALTRPTIRVKDVVKIDKELEEMKIKKFLGESHLDPDEENEEDVNLKDAPVRLPVSEGGTLYTEAKKRLPIVKKEEVVVKLEPDEDLNMTSDYSVPKKHLPDVKMDSFDSTDIVGLLTSDKPKMMLLQLPDNLPGRGPEEESHSKKSAQAATEEEPKVVDSKCKLTDLEEGKIGKILVYKSGKVKLSLGDTTFDLFLGTQPCFRQDVMSVAVDSDARTGVMINLGPVEKKLSVIPDWEVMFKDIVML